MKQVLINVGFNKVIDENGNQVVVQITKANNEKILAGVVAVSFILNNHIYWATTSMYMSDKQGKYKMVEIIPFDNPKELTCIDSNDNVIKRTVVCELKQPEFGTVDTLKKDLA